MCPSCQVRCSRGRTMAKTRPAPCANRLLALLPAGEQQRLLPKLELVPLNYRGVLFRALAPLDYAYFPNNGVVSVVSHMQDGRSEERRVGKECRSGGARGR